MVCTSPVPWLRMFRRDTPRTRRSTVGGLPVTDVPRTVFDCLALLDDPACAALLDHVTATLTSERALRMRYQEDLGLRGSPRVAQRLASLVPGAASAPERLLAQGLNSAGITSFLVNEPVHGYIADFLDPVRRLILEVDGYRTHGTWLASRTIASGRTCWWRTGIPFCATPPTTSRPGSGQSSTRSPTWSPGPANRPHDRRN